MGEAGELDVNAVRLGLAGVIAVVFVVVLTVDLIGGDGSSSARPAGDSVELSEEELRMRASTLEHPAYWVGARPGTDKYGLEVDSEGNIFIRYLTGDGVSGDPRSDFLTVGTYLVAEARRALERAAAEQTAKGQRLSPSSGFVTLSADGGDNAYVVFDDQPELQVEVYSPQPGEAAELAASGVLTPLSRR